MRVVKEKDAAAAIVVGATIKKLRKLRKWSHADLASNATKHYKDGDLSAKTVGNIEKARHLPTMGKLEAIAAAFQIELWQLFLPVPDKMTETYYRDLERVIESFRSAAPANRTTIIRVAQLESSAKPDQSDAA